MFCIEASCFLGSTIMLSCPFSLSVCQSMLMAELCLAFHPSWCRLYCLTSTQTHRWWWAAATWAKTLHSPQSASRTGGVSYPCSEEHKGETRCQRLQVQTSWHNRDWLADPIWSTTCTQRAKGPYLHFHGNKPCEEKMWKQTKQSERGTMAESHRSVMCLTWAVDRRMHSSRSLGHWCSGLFVPITPLQSPRPFELVPDFLQRLPFTHEWGGRRSSAQTHSQQHKSPERSGEGWYSRPQCSWSTLRSAFITETFLESFSSVSSKCMAQLFHPEILFFFIFVPSAC